LRSFPLPHSPPTLFTANLLFAMFAPEAFYILVAILTVALLIRRSRRASALPLPPGPRGWPLIDNLFDWPFESAWIPFAEWSKVFGT